MTKIIDNKDEFIVMAIKEPVATKTTSSVITVNKEKIILQTKLFHLDS